MLKLPNYGFYVIHFEPPKTAWRPETDLFLYEALEMVGKQKYGDGWSGLELIAREGLEFPKEKNWGIRERYNHTPLGSKTEFKFHSPYYCVQCAKDSIDVQTYQEALSVWENELPNMEKLYKEEVSARYRYEECRTYIRNALYRGDLSAHVIDKNTGNKYEIPSFHWGAERAPEIFEMGLNEQIWLKPNFTKFISGSYITSGVTNFVWAEGSTLLSSDSLIAYMGKFSKKIPSFSAPATYLDHLVFYQAYLSEQITMFTKGDIDWPTKSQPEEETILRELMLAKGKKLQRESFIKARSECTKHIPQKTKKSHRDIQSLRDQLSRES